MYEDITSNREAFEWLLKKKDDTNIFQNQNDFKVQILTELRPFSGASSKYDDSNILAQEPGENIKRKICVGRILDSRMAHEKFLLNPCALATAACTSYIRMLESLHTRIVLDIPEGGPSLQAGDIILAGCEAGDNNTLYDLQYMRFKQVLEIFEKTGPVSAQQEDCLDYAGRFSGGAFPHESC